MLIEDILACPRCRTPLVPAKLVCSSCGFEGRRFGQGSVDLLDEASLSDHDREEIETQSHSVGAYYENESKLSFHWDRLSAYDLFDLLGLPPGLVLDLGCATGAAGSALKEQGHKVVGVDLTVSCLVTAEPRMDAVVRADATHLPFRDGVFDAIVARGTLHHVDTPELVLRECRRVLKNDGRALFLDPRAFAWLEPIKKAIRRSDPGFSHDHRAFGRSEYLALIGSEFELESVRSLYPATILLAVASDLVRLPEALPRRRSAQALLSIDKRLSQTPLARLGHMLVVRARKR